MRLRAPRKEEQQHANREKRQCGATRLSAQARQSDKRQHQNAFHQAAPAFHRQSQHPLPRPAAHAERQIVIREAPPRFGPRVGQIGQ